MANVGTPLQLCAKCGMCKSTSTPGVLFLTHRRYVFFACSNIWIPQFALPQPALPASEDSSTEGSASASVQQQEELGESNADEWGVLFRAPKDATSFYRSLVFV